MSSTASSSPAGSQPSSPPSSPPSWPLSGAENMDTICVDSMVAPVLPAAHVGRQRRGALAPNVMSAETVELLVDECINSWEHGRTREQQSSLMRWVHAVCHYLFITFLLVFECLWSELAEWREHEIPLEAGHTATSVLWTLLLLWSVTQAVHSTWFNISTKFRSFTAEQQQKAVKYMVQIVWGTTMATAYAIMQLHLDGFFGSCPEVLDQIAAGAARDHRLAVAAHLLHGFDSESPELCLARWSLPWSHILTLFASMYIFEMIYEGHHMHYSLALHHLSIIVLLYLGLTLYPTRLWITVENAKAIADTSFPQLFAAGIEQPTFIALLLHRFDATTKTRVRAFQVGAISFAVTKFAAFSGTVYMMIIHWEHIPNGWLVAVLTMLIICGCTQIFSVTVIWSLAARTKSKHRTSQALQNIKDMSRHMSVDDHGPTPCEDQIVDILSKISTFKKLGKKGRRAVASAMQVRCFAPGAVIIGEGDVGETFYIIESGAVDVSVGRADSNAPVVATLVEGAHFGEEALLTSEPRNATVKAQDGQYIGMCRVLELDQATFKKHMKLVQLRLGGQIADVLAKVPAMKHLTETEREEVQKAMRVRQFMDGDIIIKKGEVGETFYIVESGAVSITVGEAVVATLDEGAHFGEEALLTSEPRNATVEAQGACQLLELDQKTFKKHVARDSSVVRLGGHITDILARVPAMAALSNKRREAVGRSMKVRQFAPGEVIIEQGDTGETFYIVESGSVNVSVGKADSDAPVVAILEEGAHFGEEALLTSRPRNATVKAAPGDLLCRVLELEEKTFKKLLTRSIFPQSDNTSGGAVVRSKSSIDTSEPEEACVMAVKAKP